MGKIYRKALVSWLLILLFPAISLAAAGKTYTKAELQKMTAAGRYPAQGTVSTESKPASFVACSATIDSITSSLGGYPAETIVNTGIIRMVKMWTNDGVVTVSCSGPDRKMVITKAPYI